MSLIKTNSVVDQLVDIYFKEEWWHKSRMSLLEAYDYHKEKLANGSIKVITSPNGTVLGYYERYIDKDTCYLWNVWINREFRMSWVFKQLYGLFMADLPSNIKEIIGEKQKLKGRLMKVTVRR